MFVKYRGIVCGIIAAAVVFVGSASAEEKEPVAVLELGGAAAWNMPGGTALGPTASVEFEPIKDNLLIEAGITPFFDNSGHRIGTLTSCFVTLLSYRRKWNSNPASARALAAPARLAPWRPSNS
jgi:hypothetical protein